FTPDGKRLVSVGDRKRWLELTPDGKLHESVGNADGLRWWDLATGECTSSSEVIGQAKCAVASPDGKVLWIANKVKQGYDLVRLDLSSGKTVPPIALPLDEPIKWMAFSADGKTLATDGEKG